MTDHSAFVRRYLGAISAGATGPALAAYYDPEAIQEEFPNRLTPNGASRNLAALLEGAERGKKVLSGQTFDIRGQAGYSDRQSQGRRRDESALRNVLRNAERQDLPPAQL